MPEMSREEQFLRERLAVVLEVYKDNPAAQRQIVSNVRQAIAEAQAAKAPIGIDKPENGYSIQELIDISHDNVKALIGNTVPNPPAPDNQQQIKPEPPPAPAKPEGHQLPSGAVIPPNEGIRPEDVTTVQVTDPILLGDTAKVVEAREALRTKMMTSKQNTAAIDALEGIMLDIHKRDVDNKMSNPSGQ